MTELTARRGSRRQSSHLYTLMEESPPAPRVPPKDARYTPAPMDATRPSSAHASGSKRKREITDITSFDARGVDEYTPKRRRSPLRQSDPDAPDETTPAYQKNVRRKKGSRNLSNLNLRHAADMQKGPNGTLKSKFQEGSLTDKPSEKPPGMFMSMIRTDSGNVHQVEELMEDYHNDRDNVPRDSVEQVIAKEKAQIPGRVAEIDGDKENKENAGILRFGARWAASFHPVALWNKLYGQSREEILREDREAAERKARMDKEKADIEARYAEMKQAGAFQPKRIGNIYGSVSSRKTVTPRDSGIVMDDGRDSNDHKRSGSALSQMTAQQDDVTGFSASDAPDTASKPFKTLKDRLHFRKPSLVNMKGDLNRVKSVSNIAQTLNHRESSSSISPVKGEFDQSTLRKSQSRYDLKKQHKLSKRVSDLESKLSQARKELDVALVDASPMPKLGSRYERFTPVSTMKRPKFMPGKLPSLPSERILMAQQGDVEMSDDADESEVGATKSVDLKEFLAESQLKNIHGSGEGEGEETIKARTARRQYPTRASTLFSTDNNNIEDPPTEPTTKSDEHNDNISGPTKIKSDKTINEIDPNSMTSLASDGLAGRPDTRPDYAALDAEMKRLEAKETNEKEVKKATTKAKKRKSSARDDDKAFKPGKISDDEWSDSEQTPKKKRKSTGGQSSSPPNIRTSRSGGAASSPNPKKTSKSSPPKKAAKKITLTQTTTEVEEFSADEAAAATGAEAQEEQASKRSSFDSQSRPLEPVYEEEEEQVTETITKVPINGEPSRPTAKATPARHAGLDLRRARSASPHKRAAPVQAGAEETMLTRAAVAAKQNPARRARSNSPPPAMGPTDGAEVMKVVPGEKGVPGLPGLGVQGKGENPEQFEWPDDVF